VRVAVRRIDGVDSVEVSLERGLALIRLRPDSRASLTAIRRVVLDNGFTPKAAAVRLAGRIRERDGRRVVEVPGSGEVYWLARHPDAPGEVERVQALPLESAVRLEGRVGETTKSSERLELQVLRFTLGP
jgi:copper chaperone CopZ